MRTDEGSGTCALLDSILGVFVGGLATACHQRQRYEFMLTMGLFCLRNVTGSPVNPVALF